MTTSAAPRPQAAPRPTPASTDAIGAWLDRLLRLTRLPVPEAAELRDELDAHLRERVRDLMLAGNDEPDAIHKSISELGDLALLAQRYREASRIPKRSLIMHAAIIAATAAALGLSTLAVRQGRQESAPPVAEGTQPGADEAGFGEARQYLGGVALRGWSDRVRGQAPQAPVLGEIPVVGHLFANDAARTETIPQDVGRAPLSEVLSMLAESQGLRPYIHWRDLQAEPDIELADLPLAGLQLDRAFEMLNDTLELESSSALACRMHEGLFEVASREYFDRRERELVTYDVSDLVYADGPLQTTEESDVLVQLITEIVEQDVWPQNGGEIGSIYCVGGKLFVNAPPRIHAQVAWLLTELLDTAERSSLSPAPDATEPGVTTGQVRGLHATGQADPGAAPTPPVADSAAAPDR